MTDARAAGEQAEVLVDPAAPASRAAGEQVEALVIPAPPLRGRRIAGEQVEVLIPNPLPIVTVGAPFTVVQIKWPDASWHPLRSLPPPPNFPWSPASLSGLGLWLDADKITGHADGDPMTTWFDGSPAGRNAVAVDTPPKYRSAAVNGHSAVEFIGGISGPQASTRLRVPGWGTALTGRSEYTMFQVVQQRGTGNYPIILCAPDNTTWQFITEYHMDGGIYWGHPNGQYRMYSASTTPGSTHLFTYHLTLTGPHFYNDGVEPLVGFTGPSGDMGPTVPNIGTDLLVGGYFYDGLGLDGYICALLWYDHALTTTQRQQVETYLKTRYGL